MATFTIENDKAVRAHLATLGKSLRRKFSATAYQGDYVDAVSGDTFGDRLQVGTRHTAKDGVHYLLVLNVLVARNSGGKVSVRVSAWRLSANTGKPVGTWVIKRTDLKSVRLTPAGFVTPVGRTNVDASDKVVALCAYTLNQAKGNLNTQHYGRPVVAIHTDRNGDNPYDTTESHLLPFGGYANARALLAK